MKSNLILSYLIYKYYLWNTDLAHCGVVNHSHGRLLLLFKIFNQISFNFLWNLLRNQKMICFATKKWFVLRPNTCRTETPLWMSLLSVHLLIILNLLLIFYFYKDDLLYTKVTVWYMIGDDNMKIYTPLPYEGGMIKVWSKIKDHNITTIRKPWSRGKYERTRAAERVWLSWFGDVRSMKFDPR